MLILATQSREDDLDQQRAQLTLHMAGLSEQKVAKVIALLEEIRRDSPQLETREDDEAVEMAEPADPKEVLATISETHRGEGSP